MSDQFVKDLEEKGLAVIPDFLSEDEIQSLKTEVDRLIAEANITPDPQMMDRPVDSDLNPDIVSVEEMKFLFERNAFDEQKKYKYNDVKSGLYRIAHNLHCQSPAFKKITFSDKVKDVLKKLGYGEPRVVQGMYILKNPEIGRESPSHQDRTYLLLLEDNAKMIGFWFALEDATLENGCLSYISGSHKTGLHRKLIKNESSDGPKLVYDNPLPKYDDKDFVSAPVKKGSCVLIDGLVVHKTAHNRSPYPRPAYTFQIYDQSNSTWDPESYYQPNKNNPFPNVYTYN